MKSAQYVVALSAIFAFGAVACITVEKSENNENTNNTNNTNNENNANNTNNTNNTNNANNTNNINNTNNANNTNNEPSGSKWTLYAHPCAGNRTDALYCDDDQTCYVGCGTTTEGRGLFVTTDGGESWGKPVTEPEGFLDGSRVNDVSRSADGLLYVAGEHGNSFGVVSLSDDGKVEGVFKRGTKVDYSFPVGSFRRNADGRAIAESNTGNGIVFRESDDADPLESWQTGYGFWKDQVPAGVQILQLDEHNGEFYGAGSTISQPPMVFLPAWDDTLDFDIVTLIDTEALGAFSGEMWGIDVNDDGIAVGGVNQSAGRGMVYTFDSSEGKAPNDRENWASFSLSKIFPNNATWIQGVCRGDGGLIYAVGRESKEGWGLVIRSTDNGQSWEDITPFADGASKSSLEEAYRCRVTEGGVIVAGAGGMFAVYKD